MSDDGRKRVIIAKPEDRGEWLERRRPYVGGSDVASLFGESPYRTAAGLARSKLGLSEEPSDSVAMRRGRILEEPVAQWCAEDLGLALEEPPYLYVVEDLICVTLDRIVIGAPGAVEVKTAAEYVSEPKRAWYWQAQAQLLAVGLEWVVIACLDASLTLQTWTVLPNAEAHEEMLKRADRFLASVRAGEVPEDESIPFRTEGVKDAELDEGALRILHAIRLLRAKRRSLQDDERKLVEVIVAALGDATDGYHNGRCVMTYRESVRHDLDVKRLRHDHPGIADEYARETVTRSLVLK